MPSAFKFIFIFLIALAFNITAQSQDESNPCLKGQAFHIVVLGSSTAAGAGPSTSDSTWVNRYRNYLQAINPSNIVTNLAVGGTNTYQIMPDWFVPPVGRPNPNPTMNISQAITLGADAVIVNMPSNDAASGFTANEQMFNFHTIVNTADSFNIPVWICTTQPRNFGATQIQIQLDVRDSVFSAFGSMAIDFWTNLADTNNLPNPIYDSGDGVHLNDAGHHILFDRVKDKNILSQLFVPTATSDFAIIDYTISNNLLCGDSLQFLSAVISNLGADTIFALPLQIQVTNIDSGIIQTVYDTLPNGLLSCGLDTIKASFNTFAGGTYQYDIFISSVDSNAANDTVTFIRHYSGHPSINVSGVTVCTSDSALLTANASMEDTILWYDSYIGTNVIGSGNQFLTPNLGASATYYAEAVRGNLFYENSIYTRSETNIAFNGYMFDLIADTALTVDSFNIKFISTGMQIVEVYSKQGTHIGYELDTNAWGLLLTDTIEVDSSGSFVAVNLNNLNFNTNDSIAFYVKLQNPSSNLAYQTVNNPITRATSELTLVTGTGIANFFANSFYPRDLAFEVHYHFGFNATGDCSTGRIPVEALVSLPNPDLGNDTAFCQQYFDITLNPGNFFAYVWSNGATANSVTIPSFYYPIGPNIFYVTVFDSIGCSARDSIIINYLLCSGLQEFDSEEINVFPNPSTGSIYFEYTSNLKLFNQVTILDYDGRILLKRDMGKNYIDLRELPSGNYMLLLSGRNHFSKKKITIVH